MFKKFLAMALFLFLGAQFACAAMDANDVRKLQQYDPGLSQFEDNTGFGNATYGYMGITGNGSLSVDTAQGVVPVTLQTLRLSYGNIKGLGTTSMTLVNGYEGQRLTLVFNNISSGAVQITPVTKFGFTSITFSATGQGCELTYVDNNGQQSSGLTTVGKTIGNVTSNGTVATGWTVGGCYSASASTQPVVNQ